MKTRAVIWLVIAVMSSAASAALVSYEYVASAKGLPYQDRGKCLVITIGNEDQLRNWTFWSSAKNATSDNWYKWVDCPVNVMWKNYAEIDLIKQKLTKIDVNGDSAYGKFASIVPPPSGDLPAAPAAPAFWYWGMNLYGRHYDKVDPGEEAEWDGDRGMKAVMVTRVGIGHLPFDIWTPSFPSEFPTVVLHVRVHADASDDRMGYSTNWGYWCYGAAHFDENEFHLSGYTNPYSGNEESAEQILYNKWSAKHGESPGSWGEALHDYREMKNTYNCRYGGHQFQSNGSATTFEMLQ